MVREFGILNTNIPEEHRYFGVPYPGTYMVRSDGLVFEKSFFAEHGTRESVNDMLQESFKVDDVPGGEAQIVRTPHLGARAYFASPTLRLRQYTVLTVDLSLADGIHVNGPSVPRDYIPVELTLEGGEAVELQSVDYPETAELHLPELGETLPVYTGKVSIKAHCMAVTSGQNETVTVTARLQYQACDDRECYVPETLTFRLPLQLLPHEI